MSYELFNGKGKIPKVIDNMKELYIKFMLDDLRSFDRKIEVDY